MKRSSSSSLRTIKLWQSQPDCYPAQDLFSFVAHYCREFRQCYPLPKQPGVTFYEGGTLRLAETRLKFLDFRWGAIFSVWGINEGRKRNCAGMLPSSTWDEVTIP